MFHFLGHKNPHPASFVPTLPFGLPHWMQVSPLLYQISSSPCSVVWILLKGFALVLFSVTQIPFSSRPFLSGYGRHTWVVSAFCLHLTWHSLLPMSAFSQSCSAGRAGAPLSHPPCSCRSELHPVRYVFSVTAQKWLLSSSPNDISLGEFTITPFLLIWSWNLTLFGNTFCVGYHDTELS